MEQKLIHFFSKNQIQPSDILYVMRENQKTVVKLKDLRILKTAIPAKYFFAALPDGAYLNITKGVIVSSSDIKKIEGSSYTMSDGKVFAGRVRGAGQHKTNRQILENKQFPKAHMIAETVFQQFSNMDNLPLPFCVVELGINEKHHDIDLVFRYCNEAFAKLGGLSREVLIDQPCHDTFQLPDKKWLLAFTEAALLGKASVIEGIQPITKNKMTVHCFRPSKNLCACLMIEDNH